MSSPSYLLYRVSVLAMCVWLTGACVRAAEEGQATLYDPILVTARGRPHPASLTPGGVAVIEAAEIRGRGAVSVADLLSGVPGVSRSSDGAWGSDISIRGLARDSVVLLMDGARVNTSTDLAARFGLVDPLEVERMEILKGPVSSLYGSGSIGGVVNVITRTGRFSVEPEWHGGLSTRVRSNPEGLGFFGFSTYGRPSEYAYVSQSYRDFASYEDGDGQEVANTQFEDAQTKVRFGKRVSDLYTLELNVQRFQGWDIGVPGTGTAPLPTVARVTYPTVGRTLVSLQNTFTPGGSALESSSLNLYYQAVERRVTIDRFPDASPLSEVKPGADHETYGGKWINALTWGEHDVSTGLDVWQRRYDGDRDRIFKSGRVVTDLPLPDATFLSSGVFVEDDVSVGPRTALNAGGRLDFIAVDNDTSPQWSSRSEQEQSWNIHAGATWRASEALSIKGLLASGYRAASLEERYQYLVLGNGVTKLGNPELDPERSAFAEVGLQWTGDGLAVGVSAFWNRLDDLIAEAIVDAETLVNENVSEALIYGYEAEARFRTRSGVQLYANVAYTVGEDTAEDEDLPGIAPLGGMVGVSYREDAGAWGTIETSFAADQKDVPAGVEEADAWLTTDVRTGWTIRQERTEHTLSVGVANVFDEAYRDYLTSYRGSAFNEPGRSFSVDYEVRF